MSRKQAARRFIRKIDESSIFFEAIFSTANTPSHVRLAHKIIDLSVRQRGPGKEAQIFM